MVEKIHEKDRRKVHLEIDSAKIKDALSSIFSGGRFDTEINALMEYTDNSFAFRDKRNSRTRVEVSYRRESIIVKDQGGVGVGREGIGQFVHMARSAGEGVSRRGAGAKCASFFFGDHLDLTVKKRGDSDEFSTSIKGFGDPKKKYAGEIKISRNRSDVAREEGFFKVAISGLHKGITHPRPTTIARALGEVYRPLLMTEQTGRLRMSINSKGQVLLLNDRVALLVNQGDETPIQVEPLSFPLSEGSEKLKITRTKDGSVIPYWVGNMDVNSDSTKSIRPGLRFYYDGRLVDIDFCGYSKHDVKLAGLVGEVHLDHIGRIKEALNLNKSAGIDKSNGEWKQVVSVIHRAISSFVKKIQAKESPSDMAIPPFFSDLSNKMLRRLPDEISMLVSEGAFDLPEAPRGETISVNGTKRSKSGTIFERVIEASHPTRKTKKHSKNERRESTPMKADEVIKGIRIEKFPTSSHELFNLGDDRILVINANHNSAKHDLKDEEGTQLLIINCIAEALAEMMVGESGSYATYKRKKAEILAILEKEKLSSL